MLWKGRIARGSFEVPHKCKVYFCIRIWASFSQLLEARDLCEFIIGMLEIHCLCPEHTEVHHLVWTYFPYRQFHFD